MDFKGFDDWVEIFRGGQQTDSNGRAHDGNALISRAVSTFNAARHEPPLVVGHPKDNAPAFGWVEKLKTASKAGTTVLLGKFKQVVPEFAALAKQGLYKKRSASFYPDGRLRHVGFLGAAPPAVKGLADIGFDDGEETIFNFESADDPPERKEDVKMMFKEFMEVFKFWKQVEENPDVEWPETKSRETSAGFTEADMEAARTEAAESAAAEERKKVVAEFTEKQAQARREARQREISAWYDENLEAGKIIPAWDKLGLREFMLNLDAEEEISFSENADKVSRLDWFKGFMNGLPKVVEFKEVATREKDVSGDAAGKLEALTKKKIDEKNISYSEAFRQVQIENPQLAQEYEQNMKEVA